MRKRGLLILLATLVVLLSGLSSLRRSSEKQSTKQATPAMMPATTPAVTTTASEMKAVMPADSVVRLAPGQRLALTIRSDSPDVALISALGLKIPVGPDVLGDLELVAPATGSFDVTLQIAKRKIGKIIVSG